MSAHTEAHSPLTGNKLKMGVVRGAFLLQLSQHYSERITPGKSLEILLDELVDVYYHLVNANRFDLSLSELEEFYNGQTTKQESSPNGRKAK